MALSSLWIRLTPLAVAFALSFWLMSDLIEKGNQVRAGQGLSGSLLTLGDKD